MRIEKIKAIVLFIFICILLTLIHPVFYVMGSGVQYSITVTARSGGKVIAPDGSEVVGPSSEVFIFDENSNAEFRFEPDTSKILSDVVLDSISLGPLFDGSYLFTSITDNHEIIGVFVDGTTSIPESAGDDQIFLSEFQQSQPFKDMISKGRKIKIPTDNLS